MILITRIPGESEKKTIGSLKRANEMLNYEVDNNFDMLGTTNVDSLISARETISDIIAELDDKLLKLDGLKYRRMQKERLGIHE